MDSSDFEEVVFELNHINGAENNNQEQLNKSYYSIKVRKLELYGNHFKVINIQDYTVHIMYNIS